MRRALVGAALLAFAGFGISQIPVDDYTTNAGTLTVQQRSVVDGVAWMVGGNYPATTATACSSETPAACSPFEIMFVQSVASATITFVVSTA